MISKKFIIGGGVALLLLLLVRRKAAAAAGVEPSSWSWFPTLQPAEPGPLPDAQDDFDLVVVVSACDAEDGSSECVPGGRKATNVLAPLFDLFGLVA